MRSTSRVRCGWPWGAAPAFLDDDAQPGCRPDYRVQPALALFEGRWTAQHSDARTFADSGEGTRTSATPGAVSDGFLIVRSSMDRISVAPATLPPHRSHSRGDTPDRGHVDAADDRRSPMMTDAHAWSMNRPSRRFERQDGSMPCREESGKSREMRRCRPDRLHPSDAYRKKWAGDGEPRWHDRNNETRLPALFLAAGSLTVADDADIVAKLVI